MSAREFYYDWQYDLKSSAEDIWPLASNTDRFNLDTLLPSLKLDGRSEDADNGRRRLGFSILGVPVQWEEEPFEWIRPYRFGVVRRYTKGPVEVMRVVADLIPQDGGGTTLRYQVWATPANPLGVIAIPIQIGLISAYLFRRAFLKYDDLAQRDQLPMEAAGRARFPTSGRSRLKTLVHDLISRGANQTIVENLNQAILNMDDLSLSQMRPYALADYWNTDRRETLYVFLLATRVGLLDFRWQMICPTCRVSKKTASALGEIEDNIHCETCLVDYTVNFEESVELTFRPNPAVRQISEDPAYCVGGPQITPHIIVHQLMGPEDIRQVRPNLFPGRYRFRSVAGMRHMQYFRVAEGGVNDVQIQIEDENNPELVLAPNPSITLKNNSNQEHLVALDHLSGHDNAATAAEVIALQSFRDLFSEEALRTNQQFSVGNITIAFTDLRASTHLYQQVGDAAAFGRVLTHFDVITQAVAAHQGAVVKTIGDAVMAVFQRPVQAFQAMHQAQVSLADPSRGDKVMHLKVGLHVGPAIAVTLNNRLDYFGATINLAARLVEQSDGADIVLSNAIHQDSELSAYLQLDFAGQVQAGVVTVKGVAESQSVWKVK